MALFLTEAVFQSSTYQGNYIDLLIEQSEIQSELLTLNEAIYQADFIIHERSRNLSESATMQLQEGFLANVWEKVKAYVAKAISWIKEFAKKIKDKVVEIYNRVKDRIKGDSVELPKGKVADMEAAVTFIEQNAKLMEKLGKQTNAEISNSIKEQGAKLKSDFDKKKESNAKMTGTQKVSFTYFDKLVKASQMNETVSAAVSRDFEAEIKALEAKHKDELDKARSGGNAGSNASVVDMRNRYEAKLKGANDHIKNLNMDVKDANSRLAMEREKTAKYSDMNDKAGAIMTSMQAEINGLKVGAAIAMELARAAGAAAVAAAGKVGASKEEADTGTVTRLPHNSDAPNDVKIVPNGQKAIGQSKQARIGQSA